MNSEVTTPMPTIATLGCSKAPDASHQRSPGNGPSAKQMVLDTVHELHNQGLPSTREAISRALGMKIVTVDESLKMLKAQELVWSPERGVYRPVVMHPPARAISKTILPSGMVKLEIGDEVLTLTPQENRMLAELQAGAAAQLAALEGANAALELAQHANRLIRGDEQRQRRGQSGEEQEVTHG